MSYPVHHVTAGDVLPIFFDTYDSTTGASITMTGLAVTDIEIYKDGSVTQRASDVGYTLLDTDGIDFDGITGIHGFSIDTGDNTDAGFYTVGSWFHVVVSAITVDGQTVSFIAAAFRLMAAEGVAGVPDVNVTHVADTAQTAGDIIGDTNDIQARLPATLVGGRIDASVGAMATDVITNTALAASAVTEIQSGLSTLTAAQVNAEVDTALDTAIPAVNTAGSVNDVLLDVLNARLLGTVAAGTHNAQSGDAFARLGAPVGASTSADIAGIQSDTNDIQTRLPAALVGGRMDADLGAISTSAAAADNLERSTLGIVTGTVGAASTTTSIVTSALSPAASVADQFKGRIVTFDANTTTAALRGQSTDITANTALGVLTCTALTTSPVSGDTFTIT